MSRVIPPKKVYHTTETKNVENILKVGLLKKGFCIYVSTKHDSWWQDSNYTTLEIDTTELGDIIFSKFDDCVDLDELLVWTNIIDRKYIRILT